jgi:hypothetical protein
MAQQHAWPCWALEHRLTQVYRLQMTRFRNFGVNCQRPGWGITRGAFDALLGALKQAKRSAVIHFQTRTSSRFLQLLWNLRSAIRHRLLLLSQVGSYGSLLLNSGAPGRVA